jgi:hypothetical protein
MISVFGPLQALHSATTSEFFSARLPIKQTPFNPSFEYWCAKVRPTREDNQKMPQ